MIEKLHLLYNEYKRNRQSMEEPTAILMHPQDWYQAMTEAYQTNDIYITGQFAEKQNRFRSILVYRTMDLEPGDIRILR